MNKILDSLYAEYGKHVALAERTSHNTRMAYHDKADGILIAIKIVERMAEPVEPDESYYCGKGPCYLPGGHKGRCQPG